MGVSTKMTRLCIIGLLMAVVAISCSADVSAEYDSITPEPIFAEEVPEEMWGAKIDVKAIERARAKAIAEANKRDKNEHVGKYLCVKPGDCGCKCYWRRYGNRHMCLSACKPKPKCSECRKKARDAIAYFGCRINCRKNEEEADERNEKHKRARAKALDRQRARAWRHHWRITGHRL